MERYAVRGWRSAELEDYFVLGKNMTLIEWLYPVEFKLTDEPLTGDSMG